MRIRTLAEAGTGLADVSVNATVSCHGMKVASRGTSALLWLFQILLSASPSSNVVPVVSLEALSSLVLVKHDGSQWSVSMSLSLYTCGGAFVDVCVLSTM